jgi:AcrR family transcriptional regulator
MDGQSSQSAKNWTMPRRGEPLTSKYAILDTFARLVAERGYDEVSLRLVAEDLDLSKGTIVHHYRTKDRLLEALHLQYMTDRLAEAKTILDRFDSPAECLAALIAQLVLAQNNDRDATVAFAREITRFATLDLMSEVRSMRNSYTEMVRRVIQDAMDEGVFRPDNVDLVTLQVFGMCNWGWTWMRPDGQWSVLEIVRTWSTSLLSGLMVRDGVQRPVDSDRIVAEVEEIMTRPAA